MTRVRFDRARRVAPELWPFLVILIVGLPAVAPLLGDILPRTHDWTFHYLRSAHLIAALDAGPRYVRWFPDAALGLGLPTLNFYSPLAYYLVAGVYALTRSLPLALNLVMAAGLIASGWTLAGLLRAAIGSRWAAAVGGLIYVYFGYHLADVYRRGALAEVLGLAWLPALLLGAWLAVRRPGRIGVTVFALGLATLLLTHNLSAYTFLPVALIYAGGLIWRAEPGFDRRAAVARVAIGVAFALGLTAVFWLPAAVESGAVDLKSFTPAGFRPRETLYPIGFLVQTATWFHDYERFQVGAIEALVLAGALILWLRRGRPGGVTGGFAALLTTGSAIGVTELSRPAWEIIPLTDFLQFSWRLLGHLAFGGALLTGVAVAGRGLWRIPVGALAVAAILAGSLTGLRIDYLSLPDRPPTDRQLAHHDFGSRADGKISDAEFQPRWSLEGAVGLVPPRDQAPIAGIALESLATDRIRLRIDAAGATALRLNQSDFPGWQAEIDGRPAPVYPSWPQGLATLDLPPGAHQVTIWFGETPVRVAGAIASGLSLLIGIVVLVRPRLWPIAARRLAWGGSAAATGAIAFGLILSGRAAAANWQPTTAELAPGLRLIGVATAAPAGDRWPVRLLWHVAEPPADDRSIALRLIDVGGAVVAAREEPPHHGLGRTSNWLTNEIVRDGHELRLPAGLPAGDYALEIGLSGGGSAIRVPVALGGTPPAQPPIAARPARSTFGDAIRLDAYGWGRSRVDRWTRAETIEPIEPSRAVAGGDWIVFELAWTSLAPIDRNYHSFVHLIGSDGRKLSQSDLQPDSQLAPTTAWRPGDRIVERHRVQVPPGTPPGLYEARVGFYWLKTIERLPIDAGPETSLAIGSIKVGPLPRPLTPAIRDDVTLGGTLRIVGHDPPRVAGRTVDLAVQWTAERPIEDDYTLFVHVVDPAGRLVAQHDGPPRGGRYPTRYWSPGEIVVDEVRLTFAPGVPPGRYQALVGAYRSADVRRLTLDRAGAAAYPLAAIDLGPPDS